MSTDYHLVCFTCKEQCADIFASGSGFHGYRVYQVGPVTLDFLGDGTAVGKHENHDLRVVSENGELPWEDWEGKMNEALT